MARKKKKKYLGFLFWVTLVLVVAVVFLLNQRNIRDALERTGFFEIFGGETDEPPEVTIATDSEPEDAPVTTPEDPPPEAPSEVIIDTDETAVEGEPPGTDETREPPTEEMQAEEPPASEDKPHVRYARVYFVQVRQDGEIALTPVVRSVRFDDSPLRETLAELLGGQSRQEMDQGLQTQIPAETRLLDVYVKDSTAYIDFSEDFRFNPLGQAGLEAQLKQVVYTTLEFSNINGVQILIEGQKRRYLGPEGLFIGEPISDRSFG